MLWNKVTVGAVMLVSAAPLWAQSGSIDPQCGAGTIALRATQDACQKAIDTFQFVAPQLGISIAGGSATLGQGTAFGALGKFSLGLRANLIPGRVPRVDLVTPSPLGATQTTYQTDNHLLGLPAIDGAVGIFPGLPVGPGLKILAVDAIASLAYIPDLTEQNVSISAPDGSLKLGFGGRLGILQESGMLPGVGLSYLRRDLPRMEIVAQVGNDQISVRDIEVQSQAWRIMVQKSLTLLTFVVGAGRDRYETSAIGDVEVTVAGNTFQRTGILARQELDRDNVFADVALNLPVIKIVGELGYVRGGDIDTYNSFGSSSADRAHAYGSVGIRLSF